MTCGTIERDYWTATTSTTYGIPEGYDDADDGHAKAVAEAKASIELLGYHAGYPIPDEESWSRAWINRRFKISWAKDHRGIEAGIDMAVSSVEIFLTETEKIPLRAKAAVSRAAELKRGRRIRAEIAAGIR